MIDPTEADIGRKVVYRARHGAVEEGVLTSFNARYVFVRYGDKQDSEATDRALLEWATP